MSGEQFCRLLKELGYEGNAALSLDWLFDYEVTKPMLQWMATNLKSSNVLTPEELQQWQKLQENDQALELDDVAKSLAEIDNSGDGDSLQALRDRVAALEKRHTSQSQQLGQIVAQRDKMLALKSAEAQAIAQLESECRNLAQEEARQTAANASTAAEASAAANALVETSNTFVAAEPLKALSALRAAFEEANRVLTEEIERTIDAGSRKTPLALGTVSASTASSAESDFANNNTELTRLQQVYSLSEQKFLESAVALAGAEAAAEAAKQRKGKEAQWASLDAALLRTRIAEAQEQLNSAKQNVATHTAKTLPALCREISELQATAVLLADCEEKIARQKRYAEQHDLIVAHLQEQEARLELAARTIHREAQRHKSNATLLSAVTKECVTRAQGSEARQQKLQAVAGARLTDDKDAVDPRDALLQALYRLLSADAKVAPSYLSREQLLETAQQLHRSVEQSQSELSATENEAHVLLMQSSAAVSSLRPLLAVQTDGQALVPRTLQTSMAQLEEALASFTTAMDTLIKDRDAKKRVIEGSEELLLERMLFVYFFSSPQTLRGLFENLDSRRGIVQ